MTTLREAAEAALEALCLPCSRWNGTQSKIVNEAITALRAALVEPPDSTKPVVERNFCPRCGKRTTDIHTCTPPLEDGDSLSPTEPVAWMDIADDGTRLAVRMYSDGSSEEVPLYLGCDHCNHPLYAAIKCRQCGRVTE